MPSSSTISSSDKSKVKSAIPSSTNKIITATVGRVYATSPNPLKWDYAGIEGAIAFVRDLSKATFYFKVVDLKGTRGVIWQHELYDGFTYNQDRTFFHSFEGDECMVGFSFADETEAGDLFKKVSNRAKYAKSKSAAVSSTHKKKKGSTGKIDKSMIGAPSGFKHVAHMGFTAEHGFSSENVDPSWQALLDQLGSMGVSEKDIRKNENFIKDFVGKRGGPGAAAKPAPPSQPKAKKVPPPAPTSKRKAPPPPPAPRSRAGNASTASTSSPAPPPPPPPPARGGATGAAAGGLAAGAGAAAVDSDAGGGGGGDGDLASALAAALNQRKENMGDSDEDESDDDW
ncbi:uncharacterized protein PFL1_01260 [Pseudozyma flocculosa PF-1]|uniref:uncharacterized protein n=1 Tax=Pseudozyma flocculosa PF-1 TaxID=1277687 RepID=UPI000456133A|nr:uncharacterized protein PFL1_01260 [Pseudozyma flocculosa PF-1]EPQ31071.1 hypothetical protein PFL1_01260 [Pseudozyma flocculosa PF-1]